MKKVLIGLMITIVVTVTTMSCNGRKTEMNNNDNQAKHHSVNKIMNHKNGVADTRISLNLSPKKAKHQLMNMRSHLVAVRAIITNLSNDHYNKAADIASSQLGLTKEMKMMCSSFGNDDFEKLGLGFHRSADKMSDIFRTENKDKSLKALSATLNYCVKCHSTFKQ